MPNTRKEDTAPATKADIGLVLQKLGTVADDVCGLKEDVGSLKKDVSGLKEDVGTLKSNVGALQKAFAEHEKTMQAQFMLVFDHVDRGNKEMREHFDEKFDKLDERFDKLDDACVNKSVEQDSSLRELDRRLRVVERHIGVPS